jgi:hypothetical protein
MDRLIAHIAQCNDIDIINRVDSRLLSVRALEKCNRPQLGGGSISVFDQSPDSGVLVRRRLLEGRPWIQATKKRLKMLRQ